MKYILSFFILMLAAFPGWSTQFYIADGDVAALKTAINTSNTNNKPDTIHLAAFGVYRLSTVDHTFVHGDDGLPIIRQDGNDTNYLTILGNGATIIRDNAIASLRLLYLLDCKVIINDVAFVNGAAPNSQGGAIIVNGARPTINGCLFRNNRAESAGAIYVGPSTNVLIQNSTFTDNVATLGSGSAIVNYSGIIVIRKSTIVNNVCLNTSGPAAIFNFTPLNANSTANVYLQNTVVAKNIYSNVTSPENGKEFDIFGGTYTMGGNFIGRYPVVVANTNPTTFGQGQPTSNNDYVGTEATPIDPKLGTLDHNGQYVDSYALLPGSQALINNAGTSQTKIPAIASSGLVPASAQIGDAFKIVGANLKNINKVQFQGVQLTSGFTTTDTTITMTIPTGARTGKILIFDAAFNLALSDQVFTLLVGVSPPPPANVTASPTGNAAIKISWQDGANESGYLVEYKLSSANTYTTAGTTAANISTFTITGLSCNQSYTVRVASLGFGGSFYSPEVVTQLTGIDAPIIAAPSTPACTGTIIKLQAPDGFAGYAWTNGETTQSIDITTSGSYAVKVSNSDGCESNYSDALAFTFQDYPDTTLTIDGSTLIAPAGAEKYQWYLDNSAIGSATSNEIMMMEDGQYKVKITSNGCAIFSKEIRSMILSADVPMLSGIRLYPLPATDMLHVDFTSGDNKVMEGHLVIRSITGAVVGVATKQVHDEIISINTANFVSGVYIVEINAGSSKLRRRIVVHH